MTQLSTNTITWLFDITAVIGIALASFMHRSGKDFRANSTDLGFADRTSTFIIRNSRGPAPGNRCTASDDRFLYLELRTTDSQLLWCMYFWPYEATDNSIWVYHEVPSCLRDQQGQDGAQSTVCLKVMTVVQTFVRHHLSRPAWSGLHSYLMRRQILACLHYCKSHYSWRH